MHRNVESVFQWNINIGFFDSFKAQRNLPYIKDNIKIERWLSAGAKDDWVY